MKPSQILRDVLKEIEKSPDAFDLLGALMRLAISKPEPATVHALQLFSRTLPVSVQLAIEAAEREENPKTIYNFGSL